MKFHWLAWFLIVGSSCTSALLAAEDAAGPSPEKIEFFERKVRPLLVQNCYTCHSADTNARGGLRVDDLHGLLDGGDQGPAVVPGEPDQSLLMTAVRQTDKLKMPPNKRLEDDEIAILAQWIQDGAAWPEVRIPSSILEAKPENDELRRQHWAWQPLQSAPVPDVKDQSWPLDDVDRFILARLEATHLSPVPDADRLALIRRVTFDLTGLPPSPSEVKAFLADTDAGAYARLVDRLLNSVAFGERWGRHWLDIARYGESTGSSRNVPYPHAWRYRDYVINAFNQDKPYDKFLQEQIAGDLLPAESPEQRDEHLIATGFLALGVKDVNQRFKVRFVMDNIDEQIDTVTRSVLALTASCARCHDHKFDPISTAEYYALAGIFHSTDLCAGVRNKMGGGGLDYYDTKMLLPLGGTTEITPVPQEKLKEAREAVTTARKEFETLRDSPEGNEKAPDGRLKKQVARQKMNRLQQELNALTDPAANLPIAIGVRESAKVGDTQVRIRGEAEKLGPSVPRGFLQVVHYDNQPQIDPAHSGRLELAQWLTSPQNPLTQRVIVNRVWQHLFGKGLVQTVDNFGIKGDTPSHPELLDHLAARFVRDGWSMKKLIRSLVLTRAYQLSSQATEQHKTVDPANRLVWRHSPRRLSAEELRDAMLATSGKLDLQRPAGSPAQNFKVIEMPNNGPQARQLENQARASLHRSVYLPLVRGVVPTSLEVFDFAEQGMVTGSRDNTTVAPQALYLLNDPFVLQQSLQLAKRALQEQSLDDAGRITLLYESVLGRPAGSEEVARAVAYLADYQTAATQILVAQSPEASAATSEAETEAATTDAASANPDEADQAGAPVKVEVVKIADAQTSAWASLAQALFGSAEFRYLK